MYSNNSRAFLSGRLQADNLNCYHVIITMIAFFQLLIQEKMDSYGKFLWGYKKMVLSPLGNTRRQEVMVGIAGMFLNEKNRAWHITTSP